MAVLCNLFDKWFHPNREQMKEITERIKELQELARLAAEVDNMYVYRGLQREMNELFMKHLTLVFFDGLRFLVPHLFLLAIITSQIRFIYLPMLDSEVAVSIIYPITAIVFHFLYKKLRNRRLQFT